MLQIVDVPWKAKILFLENQIRTILSEEIFYGFLWYTENAQKAFHPAWKRWMGKISVTHLILYHKMEVASTEGLASPAEMANRLSPWLDLTDMMVHKQKFHKVLDIFAGAALIADGENAFWKVL